MKKYSKKTKPGRPAEKPKSVERARVADAPPLSPRRKWLFRLVALVVVPLLLLGCLEGGLRLFSFGYSTSFFEKVRVGEKDYWVNNEDFSLRFFPPQLARWPGPVMMEAKKPANTYRIFILGESAARGEPEPPYAASRYLEALLTERYPGTRFEVVNLGITAINSHVILPMARDCAGRDGDLWIIYMGNNEMVGPFGAATVFGAKAPPLGFVRLNLAIQKTRIGQLLVDASRKLKGNKSNASWGGMKMFLGNQLRADDPSREVVYQNYERNLNDILKTGLDSGAKVLLSTVAVNLKDCPPFASVTNASLSVADGAQFTKLFSEGCAAQSQGNFVAAAALFEQAAKIDLNFPELQFRWGDCLARATNLSAAREHFQKACDVDSLPFRADTRINAAIRATGKRLGGDRLVLFDAAATLDAEAPAGVCGQETFYEHVHFNFDGNYRLGLAWAEQVARMLPGEIARVARTNGWVSPAVCGRRLGLTDWNVCAVVESVIERLHRPPLRDQLNNAQRMEALRAEAQVLRARMNPTTAAVAAQIYVEAIKQSPEDHWLYENYAEFLDSSGDVPQATVQWRRVSELLPQSSMAHYHVGRLLNERQQWAESQIALQKAVALRPRMAESWYELGQAHLGLGKAGLAVRDFERAAGLEPNDASYRAFVGKAMSKLGRHAEAIENFRRALQLQPDLWEAHFALGDAYVAANKFAEAKAEYEEVVRLKPGHALAHLDVGVMAARLGQFDVALRAFEEALRLEPGNQQAREYWQRVQEWKQRQR